MSRSTKALSAKQLKALDRDATRRLRIPALILMEHAAMASVEEILRSYPKARRFTVVCGRGNNGGDGFAVARLLTQCGRRAEAVHFGRPPAECPDARVNFDTAKKMGLLRRDLRASLGRAEVVVDALFGIGLSRDVAGRYRAAIEAINRSGKPVVSLDIPSGLEADTGRVLGVAVRARLTVSFVALKLGFKKARAYTGRVVTRAIFP